MSDASAQTPETPNSTLKTRARSAAILGAVALTLIFFGGGAYAMMMAAVAGIGVYEWARMVLPADAPVKRNLTILSASVAAIGAVTAGMVGNPVVSLWFILALCFLVFAFNFSQKGPSIKLLVYGMIYICFSVCVMIWLRGGTSKEGLYHLLILLFIVWSSDTAAYFAGRTFGGPKLAPSISPKKTWSGFIGSSIGAGVVAGLMAMPWLVTATGVQTIGGMGVIGYFLIGFFLGAVGQVGDLLISAFKRHFNTKDTGTLIPGHGGVLDRVDALLLVALVYGAIVRVFS